MLEFKRSVIAFGHSSQVAKAAYEIAKHTNGVIDPNLAHRYGMFHDIGKFFVANEVNYMHPLVGYQLLKQNGDDDVADICISHPFPIFDLYEYILYYLKGNEKLANEVINILKNIKSSIYIKLIQFSDKISGIDSYMTIADKFRIYKKNYSLDDKLYRALYESFMHIKLRLDEVCKCDVYDIFNL